MSDSTLEAFAAFVKTAYGELFSSIGSLTGAELSLLDARKSVLVGPAAPPAEENASGGRIRVPIEHGDEPIGEIVIRPDAPDLRPLASSLAINVRTRFDLEEESDEMIERLSQAYSENNLLCRFADLVRADEGLPANASRLLAEFADVLEHRLVVVSCPREEYLAWAQGPTTNLRESLRWLLASQSMLGALRFAPGPDGEEENRGKRHAGMIDSPFGPIHFVLTPITVRKELAGYVGLFRGDPDPPLETGEVRLLECLGLELTKAATTDALYQELRELLFSVVKSLVAAIEAKDEYTCGHSERVHDFCSQVGRALGLSSKERQTLGWAAVLHDIGKIAIDGSILNSTSRLSQEEFEKIKTHPERGCKVLEPIPQFAEILPGIRHHHERFDGRGYPDGLKGPEIPFAARIIAVADTYDAMTSARSYRGAKPSALALEEIRACAGTQFDPQVVEAFLELSKEWEGAGPVAEAA